MNGTVSGARRERHRLRGLREDLSLVALLQNPFALTPGFAVGSSREQQTAVGPESGLVDAPFLMATINTPRAPLQHADELSVRQSVVLTRCPDRTRKQRSQRHTSRRVPSMSRDWQLGPKPGEGRQKNVSPAFTIFCSLCLAPDGRQIPLRSAANRAFYGSTSKIISGMRICFAPTP